MTGVALLFSILALLVALVALAYAWRLHKEVERAAARLDRYNKALFDTGEELRRLRSLTGSSDSTGESSGEVSHLERRPNITLEL